MKNKLLAIVVLSFLYMAYTYSQFVFWDDMPSNAYYEENMGSGQINAVLLPSDNYYIHTIYSEFGSHENSGNSGSSLLRANGLPWLPDPEDGDESTGGENIPAGNGKYFLILLALSYVFKTFLQQYNLKKE